MRNGLKIAIATLLVIVTTAVVVPEEGTYQRVFAMHDSNLDLSGWLNEDGASVFHTFDLNKIEDNIFRQAGSSLEVGETGEEQIIGDSERSSSTNSGASRDNQVSIIPDSTLLEEEAYDPNPIEIEVGNTVTWTNNDEVSHTVTSVFENNGRSQNTRFDSGLMYGGGTFEHTFNTEGEFSYYCTIHPNMIGTVNVGVSETGEEQIIGDSERSSSTNSGASRDNQVSIIPDSTLLEEEAYDPNPIEIEVGNTVTWTNNDEVSHTVTSVFENNGRSQNTRFDSGLMYGGGTFEHTFNTEGEFSYYCTIHPNMIGTVNVS